MHPTASRDILTLRAGMVERHSDVLVQQISRTFIVNGSPAAVSVCSPGDAENHCLGFLLTEGLLAPGESPLSMRIDGEDASVVLRDRTEPLPPLPVTSDLVIPVGALLKMTALAAGLSEIHKTTGGTHSACIFFEGAPRCHFEDISRSAAFEKAAGAAAAAGIPLDRSMLCLSSRVPEGFIHKAARVRIPIISAVSAPTLQAAEEADRLGICLCGFVRGSRANIYSCPYRVGS